MKDYRFKCMCIIIFLVMNCLFLFCFCCMFNVLIFEKNKIVLSYLMFIFGCLIVSIDFFIMEFDFYNIYEYILFNVINFFMYIFGG